LYTILYFKPKLASKTFANNNKVGRGFVHHEEVAPFISGVATFHQIHCLVSPHQKRDFSWAISLFVSNFDPQHAILIAYWDAIEDLDSALNGTRTLQSLLENDENTGTRIAQHHIRHCFDYLRRAIMCAADTNLEWVNGTEHQSDGWWSPRTCRSYEDVFEWAQQFRESEDVGIIADVELSKHHVAGSDSST
jgi:hypothetical protein